MPLNLPRVSTYYNVSGTKTFRLGSKAILGEYGTNLQNWEKSLRKLVIPDDGFCFVQVDQAGAEALVVAYLCRPGSLRELFKNRIKSHNYVALNVFPQQWAKLTSSEVVTACRTSPINRLNEVEGWKELQSLIKESDGWESKRRYYFIAKKLGHASNYGMGAERLRMSILEETGGAIALSREEAEQLVNEYHKLFPEIRAWHSTTYVKAKSERLLRNLFNHPYRITEYLSDKILKELYAWVPQSTVGTITNIAYTKMYHYIRIKKLNWMLLANTHDSYLLQCPPDESLDCAKKAQEFLNVTLKSPVDGASFTMKSEAQVGYNWGPYHETKNPEGLREIK